MDINKELEYLESVEREGPDKVFTMYLNTDPSDPEQQGREWKIQFKNGIRNFEKYLEEADDKEELKSFQQVKQKVEKFIRGNEQQFRRGVIVFATADEEVWFATRVQMRLQTEFYWQETPLVEQLKKLKEQYPKTGIILVQQNQVRVIESYLNELEMEKNYELDIEVDDWREKTAMGPGNPTIQKDDLNARFEANKHRWYKSLAPKIDKQAKDRAWENIIIIGEPGQAQAFQNQMTKQVDEVINKNMLDHEASKILGEIFG
ncbi:hypothetical protein KM914_00055 [Virgibacillus pantothenticus]|uniref:Uncharacterized protein n=1 Tax=Virgibacillus pantothenticus TaxID=1473 RepID=A0A0L0QMP7_VIRPA|nr:MULTISPECIES: VLRF1 family aeRF1-type release factor [Virgibacillus]API93553.1 hypothetical protein BKP57_18095 [Virgibacillus sp. 6R]KNE19846.1 hypothetical protein AFK71_15615 [Virgibacillus pantothenticus]MBS7430060.1 hypothetical protein [Virgibacillus sp. 19R1-5]MBU8564843.1 hypothetical protein [Virgibacillus pantothenticus]MBU8599151.1 hypothetical protein [Virgibacillus pantothenticus]